MKPVLSFYLSLLLFPMFSGNAIGQTKRSEGKGFENATILWKISGKDCKQPSYLLGTFHLTDADWLYEYPEMKKVIENTELLLTEKFTTIPADIQPSHVIKLKAVPLLTDQQYQILDSFFVARTGEGITGNDEAENMTVAEMGSAILVTLASNAKGPNGITKYMDLDLFTRYQKLGRKVDRLDRITSAEFDTDHVEHAKQHLARSIGYIKNSDKSDWNVYQMKGVEEAVADYKQMKVAYNLSDADNFDTSSDFDFIPVKVRNQEWMKKITSHISTKPCLIAVGLAHLRFKTGLIRLLRERGYRVDPVRLSKHD